MNVSGSPEACKALTSKPYLSGCLRSLVPRRGGLGEGKVMAGVWDGEGGGVPSREGCSAEGVDDGTEGDGDRIEGVGVWGGSCSLPCLSGVV